MDEIKIKVCDVFKYSIDGDIRTVVSAVAGGVH